MSKILIPSTRSLKDILNRDVVVISPHAPISEAAYLMMREEIGSIVVVDEEEFPIGIITDRDIVTSVIANGNDPEDITVEEVMSKDIVYVEESTDIMDILSTLSEYSVRRMPVTKDGKLRGIVSVDDLVVVIATELADLAMAMSSKSKVL